MRKLAMLVPALALALSTGCTRSAADSSGPLEAAGFPLLVSQVNGLYYPPFLRQETAGPEANSYAVRLRRILDQEPPQLSVAGQTAVALRSEALDVSPLWGRYWLAPLAEAGVEVLNNDDVIAVRRMRSTQGFFSESDAHNHSDAYRASATAAALEVLAARDAVTAEDRKITGGWVMAVAHRRPSLRTAADVAQALRLLDMEVPQDLKPDGAAPAVRFGGLDENARYDALLDGYARAVVAVDTGDAARLDPTVWGNVLRENSAKLGFRDLYLLTTVAVAAKAPAQDFQPVRDRLAAERLPDGSIRESDSLAGSPEASLFVLRLRRMAGDPSPDPDQVIALHRATIEHPGMSEPERLSLTAALRMAGDDSADNQLDQLCHSPGAIPTEVTVDNAEWWSRATLACREAGFTPPSPAVHAWPLTEPQQLIAAATLVTGWADAGLTGAAPNWISADALHNWAADPQRLPTTSAYATVVRAYRQMAGGDPQINTTAEDTLAQRRGCADLPGLYRADGDGSGCDLKATWTVWKLISMKQAS